MSQWQDLLKGFAVAVCALAISLAFAAQLSDLVPVEPLERSNPPSVPLPIVPVEDTIREMCQDDTLHISSWIQVPYVQIEKGSFRLNGSEVSDDEFLVWGKQYYERKAEKGLWVQILSDAADLHQLTLLHKMFHDINFREISPTFHACPKD